MANRTIQVDYLARVEGEGALTIRLKGKKAESVELRIFEPPRFFEGILRGRSQMEAPDITARICGICPVAYQMSACHAIEDAHGIRLDGSLRALRRLLYCGEWLESHVLHMAMLHAPDFLGLPDAIAMAAEHGEVVKSALRMKKAGNAIVSLLGGREIHPINVRVGGFYRAPSKSELATLLPELDWGVGAATELLAWCARLPFPDLERDYELVALRHADEYPMNEGRIVSNRGLDISAREYDAHFTEEHVARSNALQSLHNGHGAYLCGPLARVNLDFDRLSPSARAAAAAIGFTVPCMNPFKSILARGLEVIHAFETAASIVRAYTPPARSFVDVPARAGTGYACTEAPRGILYHRYSVDEGGLITDAKIVAPTSQNQRSIEEDLFALAPELAEMPHADATRRAEHAIRNHDPCISCATHFLTLKIERDESV
jgi:coenzyme F420-reducing hydrogenase alpha subunit